MKNPGEQFHPDPHEIGDAGDAEVDRILRRIARPTLEAGSHKVQLRRSLMIELGESVEREELRELRGHSGGSSSTMAAAADPSRAARKGLWPWGPRLGFALLAGAAVAAMVLIALSTRLMQKAGGAGSGEGNGSVALVPHATTQGLAGAVLTGSKGSGTVMPNEVQIADALENGDFDLALTINSRFAGRVYVYRVKLADQSRAFYASDHVMLENAQPRLRRAQELQLDIETARGRYIPETNPVELGGAKLYRYRLDLSDGTQRDYLSDLEPDVGRRQQHQAELAKRISQGTGEVYGTIAGPDGGSVHLVRVVLSDGTIRVYASHEKPKSR